MNDIVTMITNAGPWAWLIAGLVLLALETILPGVLLAWFGIAALAVGVLLVFVDIPWALQAVVFTGIAVLNVFVAKSLNYFGGGPTDDPFLNDRMHSYIGRRVVVETAIVDGRGRVRLGDTIWTAEGPDMAAGSIAVVTSAHGTSLVVAPAPASP
ncbi:MAG: NfeD family protein [Hyphomicrobiaceae bacterium]